MHSVDRQSRFFQRAFIGVCVLQFVYRLGAAEIQPWDESLYLIRAKAILHFGCWLDQTSYAVGGLYSSTHPPVVIWLMAAFRAAFGDSEAVTRLVAAITAVVALSFVWRLLRLLFTDGVAVLSTIALAGAQSFVSYGRLAQLDIPMFACLAATAYFATKIKDDARARIVVAAAFSFGFALLTKAFQGVYLIPFLLTLPLIFERKGYVLRIALVIIGGFLMALPWYAMMVVRHPDFFSTYSSLVGSIKTGTYAREGLTQWWYYVNQVLVNFPLIVLLPIVIGAAGIRRLRFTTESQRTRLASLVWLFVMLVVMSCFDSRMSHFVLFLLLPATLVQAVVFEELLRRKMSVRVKIVAGFAAIAALVWSSDEVVRYSLRTSSVTPMAAEMIARWTPVSIAILLFLCSTVLLIKQLSLRNRVILLALGLLLSFSFHRIESPTNTELTDGAKVIASGLINNASIHTVLALTEDYPHEKYLPQLNYYTDGWFLGWSGDHQGRTMTWGAADSLIQRHALGETDAVVVYVSWDKWKQRSSSETALLTRLDAGLRQRFAHRLHSAKYDLYY